MDLLRRRRSSPAAMVAAACVLLGACAQAPVRAPAATNAAAGSMPGAHAHPGARAYALDPVHTRVAIAVDHAGFSKAIGTVSGTTGTLAFVPGGWEGARIEADVPLANLDFGDAAWNRAVAGSGLLDTGRHPVARFRSTRVEPLDDARARIHGTLALRGITRPVVLDAVRNADRRHPMPPFRRTVGFSATTTLSRAEFGSTAWSSVIGDAVEVRIELEATAL